MKQGICRPLNALACVLVRSKNAEEPPLLPSSGIASQPGSHPRSRASTARGSGAASMADRKMTGIEDTQGAYYGGAGEQGARLVAEGEGPLREEDAAEVEEGEAKVEEGEAEDEQARSVSAMPPANGIDPGCVRRATARQGAVLLTP